MVPPRRPLASNRTTSSGSPRSWAAWVRRYAVVSPVMPPPITTTRLRVPSILRPLPLGGLPYTQALSQQLAQHGEKRPMRSHCGRPPIRQPTCQRCIARLDIKIIENLDMITEKANGSHYHITIALRLHLLYSVINVGLEPGKRRPGGLTLVRQTVVLAPQPLGRSRGGGGKLLGIRRPGRHGRRNGMRRINERGRLGPSRTERLTRLADRISNCLDKACMQMPGGQIGDLQSLAS